MKHTSRAACALMAGLALSGCAQLSEILPKLGPNYVQPQAPVAAQWQTPLPHQGDAKALSDWWKQFDDPLLSQLIESAQSASASLAQAQVRIVQARATLTGAGAILAPQAEIAASSTRSRQLFFSPPPVQRTLNQIQPQASWEIDLFGGNRRAREAAQARLTASEAQWHEARVGVAVETATLYNQLRFCEAQLDAVRADSTSRSETARLTVMAADAGFQAPGNAALARASAADGIQRTAGQAADCAVNVKALAALTAIEEPALRQQLTARRANMPRPATLTVAQVPAALLSQRPDVAAAEREVAAASAEIGQAEAARYPKLTLTGSIGPTQIVNDGRTFSATGWSIGPALTLPLFDGGRVAARVEVAKASYTAAESEYRSKVRQAVREVEEALTRVEAGTAREVEAANASRDYVASFVATEARYKSGLGTLIELEEMRRTLLAAQTGLLAIQRERIDAWLALYRALGGGWTNTNLNAEKK